VVFDPRADTFLPREGSGNRGWHLNHSDAAAVMTYKRATDKPVQDGAQEQDSGARIIIIRVPRQDGSRPRRYGGLEWVSAPYPYRPLFCRLCMYPRPLLGTIKGEVRERIRRRTQVIRSRATLLHLCSYHTCIHPCTSN